MTKQQREEWIAALRSGKFKQTRQQPYAPRTGSYCCLGVLSRIQGLDYKYAAIYPNCGDQAALIDLNDCDVLSFPQIADYLEAHPEIAPADEP